MSIDGMQRELDELKQLVASRTDVKSFYDRLLNSISSLTAAEAGLVWDCTAPPYRLISEHRTQLNQALRSAIQQNEHIALLDNAVKRGQPILIPPRNDAPQQMPVIALAPVSRNGDVEIIELFLRPNRTQQDYKQWLQTLHAYSEVAAQLEVTGLAGDGATGQRIGAAVRANNWRPMSWIISPIKSTAAWKSNRPPSPSLTKRED